MRKKPTKTAPTKTGGSRDLVPAFAAAVRAARETHGWTQAQIDERAGFAAGTTAQIEGLRRGPSLRTALILAKAAGVSLDGITT